MTFYTDPSRTPSAAQHRATQEAAELTAWREHLAAQEAAEQAEWREYDERWQIFTRLKRFSDRHALQAWQRRIERPLAPYGLAFLFRQPDKGREHAVLIQAATRLWWAGPETAQPLPLLFSLIQQATERDPGVPWDLRTTIANRWDPEMADEAVYCGLGMSLLHTHTGTFEQACETANDEWDIPGVILFVAGDSPAIEDQRVIIANRRGRADFGQLTITSHRALCTYNLISREPYTEEENLRVLYEEYGHLQVLNGMWRLDQELRVADEARRALQPDTARPAPAAEPGHAVGRIPQGVAARPVQSSPDRRRPRS